MKVCVASNHLVWNVRLGGHAWVFLNWAMGLRAKGCDVVILEQARNGVSVAELANDLARFRSRLAALGLDLRVALIPNGPDGDLDLDALAPHVIPVDQVFEETDLFVNFRYGLPDEVVRRFRRSALVDIDPGLLQLWMSGGLVRPAPHHVYFTIGETVGTPGARFPDCGIEWHHVPPPVFLPNWPLVRASASAPYTTVTNWWGEYEMVDGKMINNEKRTSFLEYVELPSRTEARLELAIYHEPGNPSDIPMLREHGWGARPAFEVSTTPDDYRRYIQRSRGEFSCAKESCMVFENAWISDRTICYLASGKPAVVQHTGDSRFLPDAEGLFRFRSLEEAAAHLETVEKDYDRHARLARSLVEEHFDAEKVVDKLLTVAMGAGTRRRFHE
jgi:hypothetical protein